MLTINSIEGHKVIAAIRGTQNHVNINLEKPLKIDTIEAFAKDQAYFLGILVGIIGKKNEALLQKYDFDQLLDSQASTKISEINLGKTTSIQFFHREENLKSTLKLTFAFSNRDILNKLSSTTTFYIGFLYGFLEHKSNTIDLLNKEMPYIFLSPPLRIEEDDVDDDSPSASISPSMRQPGK